MRGKPQPRPVIDWRLRDLTADERADVEERAALIADGCKVSQDEGLVRALELFRKQRGK